MPDTPALTHLLDQVRTAVAERTPLQIRGGGSKDFVGSIQPAQLLDTRGHRGILDYAPSELVVTVAAGTPLAELEAVLADKGQCLPFEPPHFAWSSGADTPSPATVGGLVASGLAGPARASAGSVRDYVLGLQCINGQGEHLTFGGQVMKNVAGYDVSRLMVGALGTLGVITEVSLKVLPVAPAEATLVFGLDQANALEQLHRWGGEPLPLNASCWVHDDTAPGGGQDLLFVRLRGAVAAVDAASQKMLAEVPGQRMDTAQAAADWALCRDQRLPFFTPPAPDLVLWRLSVAPTAPVLDLPWPQLVEWQGGLRWLWAPLQAGAQLQAAARQASGNATVFVAARADSTGAGCQFGTKDPAKDAITRRLKAAFDPLGLFNPGRLCADL
ncbi:glycolate oxidase subunit GlcE [Rhodoferax saidenbachensis]|uniref:Glycolate oxidase FAD binding subunit n=1 Tax=Rhodoferax saidenbachensis TaxID=1484693 RepID=A0ABU1ZN85_9BURK|nr:glycolate oxidase subunit GlcE [Rhodoferax saidenbachensis]MDR7306953.1 glycolate oxidase FAD binding subunit [Rhodoferax saidenbachensis]